jgi:hypothetical protein
MKDTLPAPLEYANPDSFDNATLLMRSELAQKAQALLKYNLLMPFATGELFQAIRKADVNILTSASVEQYKNKKAGSQWYDFFDRGRILGFLLAIAAIFADMIAYRISATSAWVVPSVVGGGALTLLTVVFGSQLLCSRDLRTIVKRFWKTYNLEYYSHPIPEHLLAAAIAIKEQNPKTIFEVETFYVERTHRVPRQADPFLVAVLNQERYYIGVWEEAEYESINF